MTPLDARHAFAEVVPGRAASALTRPRHHPASTCFQCWSTWASHTGLYGISRS